MNAARAEPSMQSTDSPHRPNALVVGPMKSGTSWLYEYLKTRSDVALPSGVKETFFFDQRFDSKSLAWYLSHFEPPRDGNRIIEVAPTYFHGTDVPAHVKSCLGEIQLLVTLRDPAERAFSLFQHMRRYGFTRCDQFRDAVEAHPEMLESSRYASCLQRWMSTFGADQVTVVFLDDLKNDPMAYAAQCCQGLGLEPPTDANNFPDSVNVATHPRSYHLARIGRGVGDLLRSVRLYWVVETAKSMGLKQLFFGKPQQHSERKQLSDADRRWFIEQLGDEITSVEQIVDRDLSKWKQVA
ncbi:MAG: sulfotransferase [Rubripirellula sp.]